MPTEYQKSQGYFWDGAPTPEQEIQKIEEARKYKEAEVELARIKAGGGVLIPPPMVPMDAITMEIAMNSDTATVDLQYLVDPFLPSRCVVGYYGRGSTAKSSFVGTMSADVSDRYSTLWVSVEEPADWIKVRHIKAGGVEGTLFIVTAVASKTDTQGRVTGSSFDVYEHLETSIQKAKLGADSMYNPPRPLKLVVLDTAVGLTGWRKGESPNDDASVKRLLGYLQALAERYDVTIALIGHSNKGKHEYFADTVAGASAWTNSPRLSFVHARDLHEEYACVMRVAKTNLTTRFGVAYKTEPVHTLRKRSDGHDSVLCRVTLFPVVWGEEDSMDLFEQATTKPKEEGEGGGQKQSLVDTVITTLVELVHTGGMPVIREMVHAKLGREINRREWSKVDDRLRLQEFQFQVVMEKGEQNRVIYKKRA